MPLHSQPQNRPVSRRVVGDPFWWPRPGRFLQEHGMGVTRQSDAEQPNVLFARSRKLADLADALPLQILSPNLSVDHDLLWNSITMSEPPNMKKPNSSPFCNLAPTSGVRFTEETAPIPTGITATSPTSGESITIRPRSWLYW